ncbi:alpha/beta hydrolase [Hyalangium versicolor]|uniref:alpha/beta hydrolase n=1 Tax=Hyalangium versicolor TaxID=2861190 RepID=UPI001CCDB5C6|nr:alpha/beta hydrolase-fold protein [Hyalangium versicolor]
MSESIIRIHYDAGWGRRITVRGSTSPLTWSTGQDAQGVQEHVWTYVWRKSARRLEFKPLLDDHGWSVGGNYRFQEGSTVDVFPFFGPPVGTLRKEHDFYSPQLDNRRTLVISLPPSYEENRQKRYPVLYMHDGQNAFEDSASFAGVSWGADRTSHSLVTQGLMDEVIIVGVYNVGPSRLFEYTPGHPNGRTGGADLYGRFLVETVKPWVDSHFRTLPGREDTALMGSSLGGLVSFYLGMRYPGVFSKVACLSSSFMWNGMDLVRQMEAAPEKVPVKFYIDAGTNRDPLTPTKHMRDVLKARGYEQGKDLYYYEDKGGRHHEASWAARVHIPLRYLFPWQSTGGR